MSAPKNENAKCFAAISLLVDLSQSVQSYGAKKQLEGTLNAIDSDSTRRLLKNHGYIVLNMRVFNDNTKGVTQWMRIRTDEDIEAFVLHVNSNIDLRSYGRTNIPAALQASTQDLLSEQRKQLCPDHDALRLVIDLSTDGGPNIQNLAPTLAWRRSKEASDMAEAKGITVNVLAINIHNAQTALKVEREIVTKDGKLFPTSWPDYNDVIERKFHFDMVGIDPSEQWDAAELPVSGLPVNKPLMTEINR